MLSVLNAKYAGEYKIQLTFNNGKSGTANLKNLVLNDKRPIFSKLKKEDDFQLFKVEHSTVIWFDELDLAPEYLFYLAFMEDCEFQEQFKRWGYTT
jgi:hypothetical protein